MSRIQLIDLDTSSEEEKTGGVMISRKVKRGRLGWLSSMVEPHMKQETKATKGFKVVQDVHDKDQVQGAQEDQLSHALLDTLEITEVAKNENVETNKEEKDVIDLGNFTRTETMESAKDEYSETREGPKDVVEKPAELEVMETVQDEKEEINKEQDNIIEK